MSQNFEEVPNNPAGRLYAILAEAKRMQAKVPLRQIWAQTFGVEAENTAEVLVLHADLIMLIRDARLQLAGIDDLDQALYSRPLDRIEQVFAAANLEAQWGGLANKLDDKAMTGLEHLAEVMSRRKPEKVAEPDELSELLKTVEKLMSDVVGADLPQQLKTVIFESLEDIRHAIKTYKISGIKGLIRSLERAAGAGIVFQSEFRAHNDKPVVERFSGVVGKLNQVVALATNTQNLLGSILENLQIGSGG